VAIGALIKKELSDRRPRRGRPRSAERFALGLRDFYLSSADDAWRERRETRDGGMEVRLISGALISGESCPANRTIGIAVFYASRTEEDREREREGGEAEYHCLDESLRRTGEIRAMRKCDRRTT